MPDSYLFIFGGIQDPFLRTFSRFHRASFIPSLFPPPRYPLKALTPPPTTKLSNANFSVGCCGFFFERQRSFRRFRILRGRHGPSGRGRQPRVAVRLGPFPRGRAPRGVFGVPRDRAGCAFSFSPPPGAPPRPSVCESCLSDRPPPPLAPFPRPNVPNGSQRFIPVSVGSGFRYPRPPPFRIEGAA